MDGTAVSARLLEQVTVGTTGFARVHGRIPCLATVLIGDDPASHTYVRMKRNRTAKVGMDSRYVELPASPTTSEVVAAIMTLSRGPLPWTGSSCSTQSPLMSTSSQPSKRSPIKDVDEVTMHSFAATAFDEPGAVIVDAMRT